MADLNDLFSGTPPTYGVNVVGGGRSPFYGGAKTFSDYLTGLIGQPTPSYGGKIDPGMSPTLAALGQMMQAYSTSGQPSVMGQSAGVLGRFMNPSFANPIGRMQMGFPQYFGAGGPSSMNGGGFMGGPPGGMPPTPPWMQPQGGGPQPTLGGDPMAGPTVSPMMPSGPSTPTSINGGGFMAPGVGMTNAAMPISNRQVAVDGSSFAPGGMTAGIAPEIRQSMPTPPPLRPGQMTRQQWIDAGLKPGPRSPKMASPDSPSNIKNKKTPLKSDKLTPKERRKKIFKR